jgi:hypothetical protein
MAPGFSGWPRRRKDSQKAREKPMKIRAATAIILILLATLAMGCATEPEYEYEGSGWWCWVRSASWASHRGYEDLAEEYTQKLIADGWNETGHVEYALRWINERLRPDLYRLHNANNKIMESLKAWMDAGYWCIIEIDNGSRWTHYLCVALYHPDRGISYIETNNEFFIQYWASVDGDQIIDGPHAGSVIVDVDALQILAGENYGD